MESSAGQSGILWRASTTLIGAANEVVARRATLRSEWRRQDAELARLRLCEVLEIATDDALWSAVRNVVPSELDAGLVGQLRALDVAAFSQLEQELYVAAGADPTLADAWSAATAMLLATITHAGDETLLHDLWRRVPEGQAVARLAQEHVCYAELPELAPVSRRGSYDAREKNQKRSRGFLGRLFGGGQVVFGIGSIAGNAAVIAGSAPLPFLALPAAIFGPGSILGGIGATLSGAKSLAAGD